MATMSRTGWLWDLRGGLTLYADAWGWQRALVAARQRNDIRDGLMLLEHEPVFTFGRSSRADHLLVSPEVLRANGFGVYDIERGGSVTYHGPGQLVGYPIVDLRAYDEDVVKYMRSLEETILRTLGDFEISAQRLRGFPGVWVGNQKIAAVGVAVKRKVTMHGFALNVDPELAHFSYINPCGLGRPVTSVAQVLGHPVPVDEVRSRYVRHFTEVFDLTLEAVSRTDLEPWVSELPEPSRHHPTFSDHPRSPATAPA
ncbi:MAG: lipoyl(octanoyl) transferase [Armatimonadetes bacterium 13_1_40CM_64_14]|nr:MAG: lipoyl(octanoyl) transferase [Armatimonadetes bacterium 13_1_40CM_64_14]